VSTAPGDAEIRDVRYSRYDGERRGAVAGVVSLTRWGALRSLGARRGWKAKAIPITLSLLAAAPALIVLGVRALFADQSGIDLSDALPFSDYQAIIGIVILLFAGITTPELLCPDRRDGTLSLYFSTAVSRREYLAGRVLGAILPLLLVTLVPLLVLYGGILVFELHPVAYLQDNWAQLPRILAAGVILAVYYGLVGLAVASLTGRRAFAIGGYLLVLIAPTVVSGLIGEALGQPDWAVLPQLSVLPINFAASLFPGTDIPNPTAAWAGAYLVVVLLASAILLRRYRAGVDA
jgi:ABC-2 type transport system permease protein